MDRTSIQYHQAFQAYLRRGTPIGLSLKLLETKNRDKPTTHYIWRTRGDNKVRSRHAANEGKIFAWSNAPLTGHPGDEYNCRCSDEPYYTIVDENMSLTMSGITDSGRPWIHGGQSKTNSEFLRRFLDNVGGRIRLRDTGHLRRVVEEYKRVAEKNLLGQIADKARFNAGKNFTYDFGTSYEMQHIVYDLGGVTISGLATGASISDINKPNSLYVSGSIDFTFHDEFKDIYDIYNIIKNPDFNYGGTPYLIEDNWAGRFSGTIHTNRSLSSYKYNPPETHTYIMP